MKRKEEFNLLYLFGENLIKSARDKTIEESIKTINGQIKDKMSLSISEKLKEISQEEKEVLEDLIIDSIDGALNNFLWMIEQHEEFDLIAYENNKNISLRETSDGLSVDYWNFVDEFSQYKRLDSEQK